MSDSSNGPFEGEDLPHPPPPPPEWIAPAPPWTSFSPPGGGAGQPPAEPPPVGPWGSFGAQPDPTASFGPLPPPPPRTRRRIPVTLAAVIAAITAGAGVAIGTQLSGGGTSNPSAATPTVPGNQTTPN